MNNKGTVIVNFTIGFGNNLFQYCYARLLAEKNNLQFSHKAISELDVPDQSPEINSNLPIKNVDDGNYKKAFFIENLEGHNVLVNGYFEDYKIFKPYLNEIRSWFNRVEPNNFEDVIVHLRLQNRLIQTSHNKNHINVDSFKRVLEEFSYRRLHIVTDAGKWTPYDLDDIEKIRHEISIGPNPPSNSPWVPPEQSLEYINHLIEGFEDLEPIVHTNGADVIGGSGGLRDDFMPDFNLLRGFNQVIIFNSTFSWWAATLSGASEVAVFNPWKIAKPEKQRRNLGETCYDGWFSWGSPDDLYWK